MTRWYEALAGCEQTGESYVLVSILATTGSSPRGVDAKMIVTDEQIFDTIGGGELEHLVIGEARRMLSSPQSTREVHHLPLAAAAMQCCGGSMTVLFEKFVSPMRVTLFGGGHVATCVAQLLADCPASLNWYDSRSEFCREETFATCESLGPEQINAIEPGALVLIMTHSHELDFDLIKQLVRRDDLGFLGLIGSKTKWQRFSKRLLDQEIDQAELLRVHCPIGRADSPHKAPMAIAIGIVDQLLALPVQEDEQTGLTWKQLGLRLVGEALNE